MRKVMVQHYLLIDGKHQLVDKGVAVFHAFGVAYEEGETSYGNYSTAIIEWPDGIVEAPAVRFIRFLPGECA